MIYKVDFSLDYTTNLFIQNYWNRAYPDFGKSYDKRLVEKFPQSIVDQFAQAKTEDDARKIYQDYLISSKIADFCPVIAKGVNQLLNEKQAEIVKTLEDVYQQKVPFDEVVVHVTALSLGLPFNVKPFVFHCVSHNFTEEKHLKTSIHELNHCMFYTLLYEKLSQKYQIERKWWDLIKEGLTFLTEPDGHDTRPQVEHFREFVLANKNKTVEEVIDLIIQNNIGAEFLITK